MVIRGFLPLPLVLALTRPRERQSLLRRVLPEVDAFAQPVVVLLAPTESFHPIHDPQGGREPRAMIAHDGSVIVIEAGHRIGKIRGWGFRISPVPIGQSAIW